MVTYFENLTVKLDILYVFNTHVKFYVNQVLFTIRFIYILCIILYYKDLKFKHLIDNISIDLWFFENFVNMKDSTMDKTWNMNL